MSEPLNGNVLDVRVRTLEEWKVTHEANSIVAQETLSFIKDYKNEIKDLPTMKRSIIDIETWVKEDRQMRRRLTMALFLMAFSSLVFPILMRLLFPAG